MQKVIKKLSKKYLPPYTPPDQAESPHEIPTYTTWSTFSMTFIKSAPPGGGGITIGIFLTKCPKSTLLAKNRRRQIIIPTSTPYRLEGHLPWLQEMP